MEPLSSDPVENLRRFVQEVVRDGAVWGLRDEDGWAILESTLRPGDEVMPFWSSEDHAFDAATGDWVEYEVAPIELDRFLETFLVTMQEENCLVGPNWPADAIGLELDASDLVEALETARSAR